MATNGSVENKVKRVNDVGSLQMALLEKTKECNEIQIKLKTMSADVQIWKDKYEKLEKDTAKQIDSVERTFKLNKLSEDTKKAVLRLKARNFSVYNIAKECNENGYSITEQDVEYIINKVPILEPSLELFFKTEKEAYAKAIIIDTNIILQSQLDMCFNDINTLDDLIRKEMGKDEPDVQLIKNLINEKSNIKKVMNGIIGNKVEDEKEQPQINLEIQNLQNELRDRSDKIVRFGLNSVKVI